MNILVYDVQADSGGAASILEYYYSQHCKDKENHYYYMLSVYQLENTNNITVINVPMIKKSWFHRLYFDYFGVKKYIKKFKIDEVLSLQNTIIPCYDGKQIVYEHNALPFSEYRFTFFEDKKLWIYQNIIGKIILNSISKADEVIVQTDWMKEEISKKAVNSLNKIHVCFPEVEIPFGYQYVGNKERTLFFYPANAALFKNHKIILEACQILGKELSDKYTVVFTLEGNENVKIEKMKKLAIDSGINFMWIGSITRHKVFEWYSKSTLLFPSYIETVGLPIYEAISIGCPVILNDCKYSKCVAKNYNKALYFTHDDSIQLSNIMKNCIEDANDNLL